MNLSELPASLIELYKQTNGVTELMDDKAIGEIVWQIERVIETNLSYRSNGDFAHLYMAFDQLFFFSDAGNGDLFAFITLNGRFERDDIFVWNHENDSRTWIASNLEKFLAGWIDGSIQV